MPRTPAEHGTPARWRTGCRCEACTTAHTADTVTRRRAAADEAFPPRARAAFLRRIERGLTVEQAVPDGITPAMIWGRARRDPDWLAQLDEALLVGRDPGLAHGTEQAYRHGKCRCPECRAAHKH